MIQDKFLKVSKGDIPVRLDKFIRKYFSDLSRSVITDAVTRGDILLNGCISQKGKSLKSGDEIFIKKILEPSDIAVIPNKKIKLNKIHEDSDILVLNKPAGMPVHPIKPEETDTLANGLIAEYPELAAVGGDPLFPAFVHRIDNDTSGIVVAAKNNEAYANLREQFRAKKVKKIYIALVHGDIGKNGKIDNYLEHDPRDDRKMVVSRKRGPRRALRAVTYYKILKRYGNKTLLEVEIKTGVMHQIRCQLADLGHPVVGDKIYRIKGQGARGKENIKRHFLHSQKIGFSHPTTGKQVQFEVNLPGVFDSIFD